MQHKFDTAGCTARFDCGHCGTPGASGKLKYMEGAAGAIVGCGYGGSVMEWNLEGYVVCSLCGHGSVVQATNLWDQVSKTVIVGLTREREPIGPWPVQIRRTWPGLEVRLAPAGTPETVKEYYEEAVACQQGGARMAAAGQLRATLETALKGKEKTKLETLIRKAAEQGRITKEMESWAHEQRVLGNESMHEGVQPTYKEIEEGLDCVRAMLLCMYELPIRAAHHREQREKRKALRRGEATRPERAGGKE